MAAAAPISAILITLDADRVLDRVLARLGFCSEIVIVDSGSTDRTIEIARAHGARVVHRAFSGFGAQKRFAVSLARHDWVLALDADEVLDEDAVAAIASADLSDPAACYRLRRINFVGDRRIRFGQWGREWCVRLFNRTAANFTDRVIHESVLARGPVRTLRGSILHYTYADLAQMFARLAVFSRMKAARYASQGRHTSALGLLARGAWAFFRCYVLKLGILDGKRGVVIAFSTACNATLALAMAPDPIGPPALPLPAVP